MAEFELFTVDQNYYRNHKDVSVLTAFNRINALSCIKSAERGWLGATYSVAEILTALYFPLGEENVILSKGHAAAMQYACLFGKGKIARNQLLSYKDGPSALQAHSACTTRGILTNTGSLGMGISKAAGLGYYDPDKRYAVIVGDGELQEGQNFEALQTIMGLCIDNVTVIVDLNGYQSELEIGQIKEIANYENLFKALGFFVVTIDGHDGKAFVDAWKRTAEMPSVILANTVKAGGTKFLPSEDGICQWHSKVPDLELYLSIIEEQVNLADDSFLGREFNDYSEFLSDSPAMRKCKRRKNSMKISHTFSKGEKTLFPSTGDAFSKRIEQMLPERPDITILDGDLAQSCKLSGVQNDQHFVEMGISEQDMVSFAGGLALKERLPIVNTYAAFLKRAYEQIYVNATEPGKIIYAGHYGGLCYFTDGKTHQSLNDLTVMGTIPGMVVIEPVMLNQVEKFVDWAVKDQDQSVYFRLRRTPAILDLPILDNWEVDRPVVAPASGCDSFFITSGTVATQLAQDCLSKAEFDRWGLIVQSIFNGPVDYEYWGKLLKSTVRICIIEEDAKPGILRNFIYDVSAAIGKQFEVFHIAPEGFGPSFRTLEDCCEHFGFTVPAVEKLLLK
jgi:transketolase